MSYYESGSHASESSINVEDFIAKLQMVENLPQSVVTKAARTGADMALKFARTNLKPTNASFLGRQGKSEQHSGGDLLAALNLKGEKSKKGKKVYIINTTWYAHFKDLKFTTRSGKVIEGSHFLKYALTKHYNEIKDTMLEELVAGLDKAVANK